MIGYYLTRANYPIHRGISAQLVIFGLSLAMLFSQATNAQQSISNTRADADLSGERSQTVIDRQSFEGVAENIATDTGVISQIGDSNRATITQSRDVNRAAAANYANVYQRGNNLEAHILQAGSGNVGSIHQIGTGHQANIEQRDVGFEARIDQTGIRSAVDISQSGSGRQSISVRQHSVSGTARPVSIHTY